jgi:hypothetical protein
MVNLFLFQLMVVASVSASFKRVFSQCNLKIFQEDVDEWHDLAHGFIFGLYKDPLEKSDDCAFCDKIGRHIGGLQAAVSMLQQDRNWVDRSKVEAAGFFDKIKLLLGYYILFWSVGFNVDEMWNSGLIQTLV